ncbi:MAG: sulfatase-like hydrolase/transferase [Puniceicoccaceae bacterium]
MKYLIWHLLILSAMLSNQAFGENRPNILLIMADDIGIEGLSCYGSESYSTPNLDQLAACGLRFTHAYSQPLCTPTRVQIMTGRYNHRNWLYFGILDPRERTFGHLMQDAGYKTCIAGKWQLRSYDPPDFPGSEARRNTGMKVSDAGFDEWALFHTGHTEDKGSRYGNPSYERNGKNMGPVTGAYGPDISVDFILDFMARHRDEPVFAYYAMALPHWPVNPTPDSADWKDPSLHLNEDQKYFPDMVSYMDKLVGRLIEGLRDSGQLENTLILFYSDNGTDKKVTTRFRGQDIQGGKASPLQTGIRVPLIASWPSTITGGRTTNALVDASDFLITLADIAGTGIPSDWQHDGVSFAPLLGGKDGQQRESCFFWYDPRPGWDKEKFSRHIFALDHNYKLFSDGRLFRVTGDGLREDPVTGEDLKTDEAQAAVRKLRAVIDQAMQPPISDSAKILVDAHGEPIN